MIHTPWRAEILTIQSSGDNKNLHYHKNGLRLNSVVFTSQSFLQQPIQNIQSNHQKSYIPIPSRFTFDLLEYYAIASINTSANSWHRYLLTSCILIGGASMVASFVGHTSQIFPCFIPSQLVSSHFIQKTSKFHPTSDDYHIWWYLNRAMERTMQGSPFVPN